MRNDVNAQETAGGIAQETTSSNQTMMGARASVGDSDDVPASVRSHLVNAIVEITIDSAKGLPSVGLLSTVNAFVRVKTGGVREPFQTCVVNNDNNPVWQQTYVSQNTLNPRPLFIKRTFLHSSKRTFLHSSKRRFRKNHQTPDLIPANVGFAFCPEPSATFHISHGKLFAKTPTD
jgi:hypothetical protein